VHEEEGAIDPGERYELGSLGDLVELLIDGWQVEGLHYADRSGPGGTVGPPAAFFRLVRGPDERMGVYVPDDGRAFSHRALVALFRERPEVWKHRSPHSVPWPEQPPEAAEEPEEVPEDFPDGLALGPSTLRSVHPVNQCQTIDGLTIALTALECHEGCARLRYMAHASNARTRRQMRILDVLAVDDAGRRYCVATPPPRVEGNRFDGELVLAPGLGRARARLTVTVGTVADEPGAGERVLGPWVFPIPLTRKA